jgi:hypothetical protein
MANYSKNFLTSMTGHINLDDNPESTNTGDPVKPTVVPGFEKLPLYKPKDTTLISLNDTREINPGTGKPFSVKGTKSIKANEEDIRAIISHAKAKGVDPYTALAIGLQETELGRLDPNYGSAWATFPDEGISDSRQQNANILAKALKEKLNYATELRKKGVIPQGEEFDLQVYNGLGVLTPRMEVGGVPQKESYYGIPVTKENPLNLKKNPIYGKIIKQLREEVIRKNPQIVNLINSTKPYSGEALK